MKDKDYSNREVDRMFSEIMASLSSQDKVLVGLDKKVGETNGRVKALELWRMFLLGGLGVITSLVIPLVIYIFLHK
jgi:hypothetical protein